MNYDGVGKILGLDKVVFGVVFGFTPQGQMVRIVVEGGEVIEKDAVPSEEVWDTTILTELDEMLAEVLDLD